MSTGKFTGDVVPVVMYSFNFLVEASAINKWMGNQITVSGVAQPNVTTVAAATVATKTISPIQYDIRILRPVVVCPAKIHPIPGNGNKMPNSISIRAARPGSLGTGVSFGCTVANLFE